MFKRHMSIWEGVEVSSRGHPLGKRSYRRVRVADERVRRATRHASQRQDSSTGIGRVQSGLASYNPD